MEDFASPAHLGCSPGLLGGLQLPPGREQGLRPLLQGPGPAMLVLGAAGLPFLPAPGYLHKAPPALGSHYMEA